MECGVHYGGADARAERESRARAWREVREARARAAEGELTRRGRGLVWKRRVRRREAGFAGMRRGERRWRVR